MSLSFFYLSRFLPTSKGPNSNISDVRIYFLCTISSSFLDFLLCGNTILKYKRYVKLYAHKN